MNPLLQNNALSGSNLIQNASKIISMMKGQNVEIVMKQMLQNNPQFRQFYEQNKDKSLDQIATDYGVDMNLIRQLLNNKN